MTWNWKKHHSPSKEEKMPLNAFRSLCLSVLLALGLFLPSTGQELPDTLVRGLTYQNTWAEKLDFCPPYSGRELNLEWQGETAESQIGLGNLVEEDTIYLYQVSWRENRDYVQKFVGPQEQTVASSPSVFSPKATSIYMATPYQDQYLFFFAKGNKSGIKYGLSEAPDLPRGDSTFNTGFSGGFFDLDLLLTDTPTVAALAHNDRQILLLEYANGTPSQAATYPIPAEFSSPRNLSYFPGDSSRHYFMWVNNQPGEKGIGIVSVDSTLQNWRRENAPPQSALEGVIPGGIVSYRIADTVVSYIAKDARSQELYRLRVSYPSMDTIDFQLVSNQLAPDRSFFQTLSFTETQGDFLSATDLNPENKVSHFSFSEICQSNLFSKESIHHSDTFTALTNGSQPTDLRGLAGSNKPTELRSLQVVAPNSLAQIPDTLCRNPLLRWAGPKGIWKGHGGFGPPIWDFGISTHENPFVGFEAGTHFPDTGTYTITIKAPGKGFVADTLVLRDTVHVIEGPDPGLQPFLDSVSGENLCQNNTLTLTAGEANGDSVALYFWEFNGGKDVQIGQTVTQLVEDTVLHLTAFDTSGCGTRRAITLDLDPSAGLDFDFSQVCQGSATTFNATLTYPPPLSPDSLDSLVWHFGDTAAASNTAEGQAVNHLFSDTGQFLVTATAYMANGCQTARQKAVRLFENPTIRQVHHPKIFYPQQAYTFTAEVEAPQQSIASYQWVIDNTDTLFGQSIRSTAPQSGAFSIRLRATTDQGCTALWDSSFVITPSPCDSRPQFSLPNQASTFQSITPSPQYTLKPGETGRWDYCISGFEEVPSTRLMSASPGFNNSKAAATLSLQDTTWLLFATNNEIVAFAKQQDSLARGPISLSPSGINLQNLSEIAAFTHQNQGYLVAATSMAIRLYRIAPSFSSLDSLGQINPTSAPADLAIARLAGRRLLFSLPTDGRLQAWDIADALAGNPPNAFPSQSWQLSGIPAPFQELALIKDCNQLFGVASNASSGYLKLSFGLEALDTLAQAELSFLSGLGTAEDLQLLREGKTFYGLLHVGGLLKRFDFGAAMSQPARNPLEIGTPPLYSGQTGTAWLKTGTRWEQFFQDNSGNLQRLRFPEECLHTTDAYDSTATPEGVRYQKSGTKTIAWQVEDSLGNQRVFQRSLSVNSAPPAQPLCNFASITLPATATANDTVLLENTSTSAASHLEWGYCEGELAGQSTGLRRYNLLSQNRTRNNAGTWAMEGQTAYFLASSRANQTFSLFKFEQGLSNPPSLIELNHPKGLGGTERVFLEKVEGQWLAVLPEDGALKVVNFGDSLALLSSGSQLSVETIPIENSFAQDISGADFFQYQGERFLAAGLANNQIQLVGLGANWRNNPLSEGYRIFLPPSAGQTALVTSVRLFQSCDRWYGLAGTGSGQLFFLRFGTNLMQEPAIEEWSQALGTSLGLWEIRFLRDAGQHYALVSTSGQSLFKINMGPNLATAQPEVSTLSGTNSIQAAVAFDLLNTPTATHLAALNLNGGAQQFFHHMTFESGCQTLQTDTLAGGNRKVLYPFEGTYAVSLRAQDSLGRVDWATDTLEVKPIAGDCPVQAGMQIPNQLCAGETFQATTGTNAIENATWDFCQGDISGTPQITRTDTRPEIDNGFLAVATAKDASGAYAFAGSWQQDEIFRYSFENGYQNPPTDFQNLTAGTNLGANVIGMELISKGEQSVLFSFGNQGVVRMVFDSLGAQPLIQNIGFQSFANTGFAKKLFVPNQGWHLFFTAKPENGPNELRALFLGEDPAAGAVSTFSLPLNHPNIEEANLAGLDFTVECGSYYALVGSKNGEFFRLNFGNSVRNTPEVEDITSAVNQPQDGIKENTSLQLIRDAGTLYALVFSRLGDDTLNSRLDRFTFGNSITSNNILFDRLGQNQTLLQDVFNVELHKDSASNWNAVLLNRNNGAFGYLTFPNACGLEKAVFHEQSPNVLGFQSGGLRTAGIQYNDPLGRQHFETQAYQVEELAQFSSTVSGLRCAGQPLQFVAQVSGLPSDVDSVLWNFGDGSPQVLGTTGDNIFEHTYASPGNYTARIIVKGQGCRQEHPIPLSIAPPIAPLIEMPADTLCSRIPQTFQALSANEALPDSAQWQIRELPSENLIANGTGLSFTTALPDSGRYQISLRLWGQSGCDSTVRDTFRAIPGPEIAFQAQNTCFGDTLQLLNQSSLPPGMGQDAELSWDLGNGRSDSADNPTVRYQTPGQKIIGLTIRLPNGCAHTRYDTLSIFEPPQADIVFSNNCSQVGTAFSLENIQAQGGISQYEWTFGDGGTSSEANPVHTYTNADTFSVAVTLTNPSGCQATLDTQVVVSPGITVDFALPQGCVGEGLAFENLTQIGNPDDPISYQWDFGNGVTSDQANPQSVVFVEPGNYPVTLKASTESGCTDSTTQILALQQAPEPAFAIGAACEGVPVQLQDTTQQIGEDSIVSRIWEVGLDSLTGPSPSILLEPGQYNARLTVETESGCRVSSPTQNFNVPFAPSLSVGHQVEPSPLPVEVSFSADLSAADTIVWNYGDGSPTDTVVGNPSTTHAYDSSGVFAVTARALQSRNCSAFDRDTVQIFDDFNVGVKVSELQVLNDTAPSAGLQLRVRLENEGNTNLQAIDLKALLNDDFAFEDTWAGNLRPGASTDYTLRSTFSRQNRRLRVVCVSGYPGNISPEEELDTTNNRACTFPQEGFEVLNLFPSPNSGSFRVNYAQPEGGEVTFRVVDAMGRQVLETTHHEAEAGIFSSPLKTGAAPGLYYLIAEFGNTRDETKFLIEGPKE